MKTQIRQDARTNYRANIRNKLSKVADSMEDHFKYPTGRSGLETLKYDSAQIDVELDIPNLN